MAPALEGIKVIETASAVAGPMAGRLLADWGADVIHVERPVRSDQAASQSDKLRGVGGIMSDIDYAGQDHNRNKRGMTLDLSQEGGREILNKMLGEADVLLSNFRSRELEKFGLAYETLSRLNSRLICANITGYGKNGPDKDLPAYQPTAYAARSGILYGQQRPGASPAQTPIGIGDNVTALALAYGIMAALFMRERTGVGQEVDVSLFHTGVFALSYDIAGALVTGQDRPPIERKDMDTPHRNSYQTKDGRWLYLSMAQPELYWSRFCRAIGREDLEHDLRFGTVGQIADNYAALFEILEEAFLSRTLEEWETVLNEAGLPWAPVQNLLEVVADPQARANDFFTCIDHPTYGRIELVANPVKLGNSREVVKMPAPELGQHTEEVLLEYGYTWDDILEFKEKGIVA